MTDPLTPRERLDGSLRASKAGTGPRWHVVLPDGFVARKDTDRARAEEVSARTPGARVVDTWAAYLRPSPALCGCTHHHTGRCLRPGCGCREPHPPHTPGKIPEAD